MSVRVAAILLVFSVACAKPAEKVVPPAPKAAAATAPSASVHSEDPLRKECDEAITLTREWDGDIGKLDEARKRLMAILAKDKGYARAYVGLARAEYHSGYVSGDDFESTSLNRAWKFVQHALKLDPNLFEAHLTAGWISRYMGELDSARASLDRAEELQPGTIWVKLGRAELASAERNTTETMRLAKEVIAESNDPRQQADGYGYLIDIYRSGGHADQVDELYREQLKLLPGNAWMHGNYAGFLLRRGQTDAAIREAETAVRIRSYPMAVTVLARGLMVRAEEQWKSNQVQESGKTVEKIAALAGEEPDVCAWMGAFYEGAAIRGKDPTLRKKALEWYRKALAKAPENREVQRAVERLQS